MNKYELRRLIEASLKKQGFRFRSGLIVPPRDRSKDSLRALHSLAVNHKKESARNRLARHESRLLDCLANGSEVDPKLIVPRLIEVTPRSDDELLFRYAALHWSIPVSSGYGRRLRFLVKDDQNGKLIGIIGLGDPVFALGARDKWIGWNRVAACANLRYVMDAFALGAVPPYSLMLGGKLVAMLVASNEVRRAFSRKYRDQVTLIQKEKVSARLALITTTSALGRSSIYNRLRHQESKLYLGVGFTRGFGEFHFSNGLYSAISDYALRYCVPTAKVESWGSGFRNKREVVKKCLSKIGLSSSWIYHGVEREIFVVPLASNTREFLRGEHRRLRRYDYPVNELARFFSQRWLLPRIEWDDRYKSWTREQWRLWPH